nr:hypothetical protein [uncultured Dysosmobacter sp.]
MNLTNDSRTLISDEELMEYFETRIGEAASEKLDRQFMKRIEERYGHLYRDDEEREDHLEKLQDDLDSRISRLRKRAYVVFEEEE